MGMPATIDRYFTREMVLALPDDGNRYELVYGELLVSPAPVARHQLVLGRLHARLFTYLERTRAGRVYFSPADISWGREADLLVQPDLFVVAPEDARRMVWREMLHLSLVVEVLSPSTSRYDRFTKRRLYQQMNVPQYWIVDPVGEAVEVWTPAARLPRHAERAIEWQPSAGVPPFVLPFDDLFAD